MKPVTIPAQPDYAKEPDGIPFVLTQAERSKAALYRAHLIRIRDEKNRQDKARQLNVDPERIVE